MSYYDQLHPWCIVRLLPNLRRVGVARFRRRNDAEEHLKLLHQMTPNIAYAIIFDLPCNFDLSISTPKNILNLQQWND